MAQQDPPEDTPTAAPLPVMAVGHAPPSTDRSLANPWQQSALRLKVDCRKGRLRRTRSQKEGRITPSRFRQGDIEADAEGVHFTGVRAQPIPWLRQLAFFSGAVLVSTVLYTCYQLSSPSHPPFNSLLALLVLFVSGLTTFLANYWNSSHTVPIQFTIPWEAVTLLR